jgi:hypothetical protein
VAYGDKYVGAPDTGTVLTPTLDRDCYVRTAADPPVILVGHAIEQSSTGLRLCCATRGRLLATGRDGVPGPVCVYGCGHTSQDTQSFLISLQADEPALANLCLLRCFAFA